MEDNEYKPWWPGTPNGGTRENCGALWVAEETTGWFDSECSNEKCTVCQIPSNEYFLLRGKVRRKFEIVALYTVKSELVAALK